MPHPSKSKGNRWESECCRLLSDAFGDSFIRVPNSGAYTGGKNAARVNGLSGNQVAALRGDIISPQGWRIIWECKHVKPGTISDILEGPSSAIQKWWKQANADAREGELVILLTKEDRKSPRAWFAEDCDFQFLLEKSWACHRLQGGQRLITCLMSDLLVNAGESIRERATDYAAIKGGAPEGNA